jgi:hypothetical protein
MFGKNVCLKALIVPVVYLIIASFAMSFPVFATTLTYGRHYPNGSAAVDYLYGVDGTWKDMTNIQYTYNFYSQYGTVNHPYNPGALIQEAKTNNRTCRDANGHLLLDFNHDGEIDTSNGGFAFHEHNGKGINGSSLGSPFLNFWFDDNWLTRNMSVAYGKSTPNGLSQYTDFSRWSVMDGATAYFTPYGGAYFDQLALDGLYYFNLGQITNAVNKWDAIKNSSGAAWDGSNQRYTYNNINEVYHLGLWLTLSANLMDDTRVAAAKRVEILQHYVSGRSLLLSWQEKLNGTGPLLGWRSDINSTSSLINTETVSCCVLGLGANAKYLFEAGKSPLSYNTNKNYFLRSHNVLSAAKEGGSQPGYMSYGPYWNFPTGSYTIDFLVRAPGPSGNMISIDVYDSNSGRVLASRTVAAGEFNSGNQWTKCALGFSTSNINNSLEFRCYWNGTANMDLAFLRLK